MNRRYVASVLLGCFCLLLAACGEDGPDVGAPVEEARPLPSPQVTHTVAPTATSIPPTPSADADGCPNVTTGYTRGNSYPCANA